MNKKAIDPYVYPETNVLINYFGIKNQVGLDLLEITFFRKRLAEGIPHGNFDFKHYKSIHKHIFQDLYSWAGVERSVSITKGESLFAMPERIAPCMEMILNGLKKDNYLKDIEKNEFAKKAAHYFSELNAVHPFREGNGRTLRLFIDEIAYNAGYILIWDKVEKGFYIKASIDGFNGEYGLMIQLFEDITLLKNINVSQNNDQMSLINQTNISISDSLYNNILKYIEEVEKYKSLLNLVYTKGFEKIDVEITSSLNSNKQSIKELIYRIRGDKTWDIIGTYEIPPYKEMSSPIDLQKIKAEIISGQLSSASLNSILIHINNNALSSRESKGLKHTRKIQ